MEIQELWRVVRERWRIVVIMTLLCISLSLGWSLAGPVSYKAQGRIIISTSNSLGTADDAYSGERVSVERAPAYAQFLRGPEVAERASRKLGGAIPPRTIQESIDAEISSHLPMVVITATSRRANDAVQIVSAAEQGLQQYVREIERAGRDGSLTSVALTGDAATIERVGNPIRNAVLAALLGLVVGTMLAVYRDRTDPIVKGLGQVAGTGLDYRGTIGVGDGAVALDEAFRRLAVGGVAAREPLTGNILVVGVDPECDTLFIARGLAGGLLACGRKVTLVDATGDRDAADRVGLSEVVDGSRYWAECAVEAGTDNLRRMGIGTRGGSLDALLINSTDLRRRLPAPGPREHIVIAGPSMAHSPVATALTALADCALVVVRQGRSRVSDVVEAKMTLDAMGTQAIGLVFVIGARSSEAAESTPGDADEEASRPSEGLAVR